MMEKLIELLNEYRTEKLRREMYMNGADKEAIELSGAERINEYEVSQTLDSQNYLKSFVKWLVENDKIDKRKIDTRLVRNVESHYDEDGYWVENSYEDYSNADTLLILLAISDTPIEDLISYLK